MSEECKKHRSSPIVAPSVCASCALEKARGERYEFSVENERLRAELSRLKAVQGEAVAWRSQCLHPRAGKQSSLFHKKYQAENWATHWRDVCGLESLCEPLYLAPPNPDATQVMVPKQVLGAALGDNPMDAWDAMKELRALLAKSEGVKP